MKATALLCVFGVLLVTGTAFADISPHISYQGVLRDASGTPVPDDDYSVTFSIYDVENGGVALWTETQTLAAEEGIINATLGSITSLTGLAYDVPYWLGISVEGEAELAPRTEFTSVPYAAHAGVADVALTSDADWQVSGDDIYHVTGKVAIGHDVPSHPLDVTAGDEGAAEFVNNSTGTGFTVTAVNNTGTAGAFFSNEIPSSYPAVAAAVFGVGGTGSRGAHFSADDETGVFATSTTGRALHGYSIAGYSGYFSGGGLGVRIADVLDTDGFEMSTGAASGYVLTSDANGVGTWQAAAALSDGDWTVDSDYMYTTLSGGVGIGMTYPGAKLDVIAGGSDPTMRVRYNGAAATRVMAVSRSTLPNAGYDLVELKVPATAPDDCQFIEAQRDLNIVFAVDGDGLVTSESGAEFNDSVIVESDAAEVGKFTANTSLSTTRAVSGIVAGTSPVDAIGVYGESIPAANYGYGGGFQGGHIGAFGTVEPAGVANYYGLVGDVSGGDGSSFGVYGSAIDGYSNYGVYGIASGATNADYAGFFSGDVHITGTLTGGKAGMRIDHPLDPANQYLDHAFVGSDELVNFYSGNVALDGRGEATVRLPDWFEAVNADVRYQLTAIGAPGPNLYIAEKISGGAFRIAGGEPGSEVSWQVTGVRKDPFARAAGFTAEQRKPERDAGRYAHPEVLGAPRAAGIGYVEPPGKIATPEGTAREQRVRGEGDE